MPRKKATKPPVNDWPCRHPGCERRDLSLGRDRCDEHRRPDPAPEELADYDWLGDPADDLPLGAVPLVRVQPEELVEMYPEPSEFRASDARIERVVEEWNIPVEVVTFEDDEGRRIERTIRNGRIVMERLV